MCSSPQYCVLPPSQFRSEGGPAVLVSPAVDLIMMIDVCVNPMLLTTEGDPVVKPSYHNPLFCSDYRRSEVFCHGNTIQQLSSLIVRYFAGIHPYSHSPGMFSWFPILFPFKVCEHLLFKFYCPVFGARRLIDQLSSIASL